MVSEPDPDRESDLTVQARGWARVARASARVHSDGPAPGVNAVLFDAIEYAATEARLGMRDLVDAYIAGAPPTPPKTSSTRTSPICASSSAICGA